MTKAVLITGAAGGIGVALCDRMRRDGYLAIGMDQCNAPAADIFFQIDLSELEQLVETSRKLCSDYDLKALIHNGAIQPVGGVGDTTFEDWTDALRVNVLAVEALVSVTRESLAVNNGSVVVISSVHARATTGGITAYATTKAAVEGWVRSAAMDLGPSIRVNAIAPGAIDTAKLREGFARWGEKASERKEILRQRTALRRIGRPSDVAAAASFLIGDDAHFITGTTLVVDGGATARLGSE